MIVTSFETRTARSGHEAGASAYVNKNDHSKCDGF
jgi:hypothetical protein